MNKFDFQDLPTAYFSDNNPELRNQFIKNQVKITECHQGNLEESFFSNENIELINKQLILTVYKKSNNTIKIDPQSPNALLIVMRYVFIEYARHLPYNISEQIKELNCKVINEILPNVMTNINQKLDYMKEIENPRQLIPLPINVNKNNKNIPSIIS